MYNDVRQSDHVYKMGVVTMKIASAGYIIYTAPVYSNTKSVQKLFSSGLPEMIDWNPELFTLFLLFQPA